MRRGGAISRYRPPRAASASPAASRWNTVRSSPASCSSSRRASPRTTELGSGSGESRRFVERTIAWVDALGRLRRRSDRHTEIQGAFLRIACVLTCSRSLDP